MAVNRIDLDLAPSGSINQNQRRDMCWDMQLDVVVRIWNGKPGNIKSANRFKIDNNPLLPDQSRALQQIFQTLIIGKVQKSQVNGYTQEVVITIRIIGDIQSLTPQQLMIKPEGQRHWKWKTLHTAPGVDLNLDDVIYYDDLKYRVLSKTDNHRYGYLEFHLAEDFQRSLNDY